MSYCSRKAKSMVLRIMQLCSLLVPCIWTHFYTRIEMTTVRKWTTDSNWFTWVREVFEKHTERSQYRIVKYTWSIANNPFVTPWFYARGKVCYFLLYRNLCISEPRVYTGVKYIAFCVHIVPVHFWEIYMHAVLLLKTANNEILNCAYARHLCIVPLKYTLV